MTRTLEVRSAIATIVMGMALVACSAGDPGPDSSSGGSLQAPPSSLASPTSSIGPSTTAPEPSESPQSETPEAPAKSPLVAYPEITIASLDSLTGNFVVGGYVTGIVEIGGSCTFIVTNEDTKAEVMARTTGVDNSDSTSCGSVDIAGDKIPNGKYSVVLEYANSAGSASSDPLSVEVSR